MIREISTKIKENKLVFAINKIMNSKLMLIAIVLLAAISNVFALEIPVYYIYTFLILVAVLFCDDLISVLPMSCCGYMTFAKKNNPLATDQTSTFLDYATINHLIVISIIIATLLSTRIIYELVKHKGKRNLPKLSYGFLLLGITYMLGGMFSPLYNLKTTMFGLVQIISLSFTYFCFYYTIKWEKVKKDYFAFLFCAIGGLMVIEVFNMLLEAGFFTTKGAFSRSNIYTGWGINNNVAGICVLTIPAPLYYTLTKKDGWKYILLSTLFLLSTILTQSRNGMLMGTIIYSVSAIVVLIKSPKKEKIKNLITYACLLGMLLTTFFIFNDLIKNLFSSIYKVGTSDSGRFDIYINGLKQYLQYPIFGNGFYACEAFRWGVKTEVIFLPGRYHNTYVQILASCGTIGMLAYLFHRYQTLKLFLKSKNPGALIIFITLFGFILISLLDCHFHNFGPGLIYSAILLLLEKVYCYNEKESL